MLFEDALQSLTRRLGEPSHRQEHLRARCEWIVLREAKNEPNLRVVLEAGPSHGSAYLWIAEPDSPAGTHDEHLVLVQEPDIDTALDRVRSHMNV
jgi:hypothetical protein